MTIENIREQIEAKKEKVRLMDEALYHLDEDAAFSGPEVKAYNQLHREIRELEDDLEFALQTADEGRPSGSWSAIYTPEFFARLEAEDVPF